MENDILQQLHAIELEILCIFAEFCEKHQIQYSLAAGTALGAIRHQGFIPWDDDVDITMTRLEFMRFYECWEKAPIEGYYLQTFLNDSSCSTCHAKFRKDNTVLLMHGENENDGHHGIWLDIFPMDKISEEQKSAKKLLRKGTELILLTRANVIWEHESYKTLLTKRVVRLLPKKTRMIMMQKINDYLCRNDERLSTNYSWISMSAFMSFQNRYPIYTVDSTKEVLFEGKQFKVFHNMEENLRILYGDYMKLPPEEKRVNTHNPVKVQF